jgi:hypothetical protein
VITQQAKFIHREAVIRWELGTVVFVVDQRQGHDEIV